MRCESLKEQRERIFSEALHESLAGPSGDVDGEADEPMVGNIRAQLIADPDGHQTSFHHFRLTGENWIGTTCYPDGMDVQGGDQ